MGGVWRLSEGDGQADLELEDDGGTSVAVGFVPDEAVRLGLELVTMGRALGGKP